MASNSCDHRVPYHWEGLSPRELRDIANLPQGEPIILPYEQGSVICVLRPSADSI